MIVTRDLGLELEIVKIPDAVLGAVKSATIEGKSLNALENVLNGQRSFLRSLLKTQNNMPVLVFQETENAFSSVIHKKLSVMEHLLGEAIVYSNPFLQWMVAYGLKLELIDRKDSAYRIAQISQKIEELGTMPLLAAIIPSDIFLFKDGDVYSNSVIPSKLLTPYSPSHSIEVESYSLDDILNHSLQLFVTGSDAAMLNQIRGEAFAASASVDLSEIYSFNNQQLVKISAVGMYSMRLDSNIIHQIKSDYNIGITIAALAHRILSRGESRDVKGHIKRIQDLTLKFEELRGHRRPIDYIGEQIDVNLGYAMANAIVTNPVHTVDFANFLNAFEELTMHLYTADVVMTSNDLNSFKYVNYIKDSTGIVDGLLSRKISVTPQPDGSFIISSLEDSFSNMVLTHPRNTVGAALAFIANCDIDIISLYFKTTEALIDALLMIDSGGLIEINQSQNHYAISASSVLLARRHKHYVHFRDFNVKSAL